MAESYSLPGSNTLLVGGSGTGKTHSLRTFVPLGITPFIIFSEPGMRTVADIPCPDLHFHYIQPAKPSFDDLAESARKINTSHDFEALTKQKNWNKKGYTQFIELMGCMNQYTCDRCGELRQRR